MSYYLHFYAFPEETPLPPGIDSGQVPAYLEENATGIGELQFGPGRCGMLLAAASDVCGCNLSVLSEGPWRGLDSLEYTETFGGMSHEQVAKAVELLRIVAANPAGRDHLLQVAAKHKLAPLDLAQFLERLLPMLEKCAATGQDIVAVYS